MDFVFYPLTELQRLAQAETLPDVYRRGYEVLVDKEGLAVRLPACPFEPSPLEPPGEETFRTTINAFWYGAVYVAKQIRRRQFWLVKYRDWTMKTQLLQVMEWHAQAVNGWAYDTWHDGKFVAEWTDPQTWATLEHTFGHFDAGDSWRALLATLDLFRRLAGETAAHLGHPYPALLDERVTQFINQLRRKQKMLKLEKINRHLLHLELLQKEHIPEIKALWNRQYERMVGTYGFLPKKWLDDTTRFIFWPALTFCFIPDRSLEVRCKTGASGL